MMKCFKVSSIFRLVDFRLKLLAPTSYCFLEVHDLICFMVEICDKQR